MTQGVVLSSQAVTRESKLFSWDPAALAQHAFRAIVGFAGFSLKVVFRLLWKPVWEYHRWSLALCHLELLEVLRYKEQEHLQPLLWIKCFPLYGNYINKGDKSSRKPFLLQTLCTVHRVVMYAVLFSAHRRDISHTVHV